MQEEVVTIPRSEFEALHRYTFNGGQSKQMLREVKAFMEQMEMKELSIYKNIVELLREI